MLFVSEFYLEFLGLYSNLAKLELRIYLFIVIY